MHDSLTDIFSTITLITKHTFIKRFIIRFFFFFDNYDTSFLQAVSKKIEFFTGFNYFLQQLVVSVFYGLCIVLVHFFVLKNCVRNEPYYFIQFFCYMFIFSHYIQECNTEHIGYFSILKIKIKLLY